MKHSAELIAVAGMLICLGAVGCVLLANMMYLRTWAKESGI